MTQKFLMQNLILKDHLNGIGTLTKFFIIYLINENLGYLFAKKDNFVCSSLFFIGQYD